MPRPASSHSRSFPLAALLASLVAAGCADPAPPPPPPCDLGLVPLLEVDRAMDHLRMLSVDIGPRVAGSPQEREAADYLAAELESYGYAVEIQSFDRSGMVAHLDVVAPEGLRVNVAAGRIAQGPGGEYPHFTPDGGITGTVVDCGDGACPEGVAGQIALVTPAEVADAEAMLAAAADAGARAVLVHSQDWRRYTLSVAESPVPFVTLNLDAAEALRETVGETVQATLHIRPTTTSQNVVATRVVEGNPDAPVVIFTAHYDSVEKSPGASDNGSGTVGMLEIARVLARVPTEVELRFAAVGAEEVGLVGSRHYVAQLDEAERARIVANFNMDMIGTAGEAQTQLFVNTLDGDNLVAQSARAARDSLGYPEELLRAPFQRGASDHVAFADAGIPAANFIWREPETIALEPWYHHPYDAFERVSPERLQTAMEIVLGASLEVLCTP